MSEAFSREPLTHSADPRWSDLHCFVKIGLNRSCTTAGAAVAITRTQVGLEAPIFLPLHAIHRSAVLPLIVTTFLEH